MPIINNLITKAAFRYRYNLDKSEFNRYHIEVFSAGLEPKIINPDTIRAMEEEGFDMSQHYSKDLRQFIGKVHFGYLITAG